MQKALVFGTGNLYQKKEKFVKENFEIKGYLDNREKPGGGV